MKTVRFKPLDRRTFLRGAGACIALPMLEAMELSDVSGAPSRFKPKERSLKTTPRMICCYVPQGVNIYDWFPKDKGPNWTLTPTLQPLAKLKTDFTVISGIGHPNGPGGHQGNHTWLTAADLKGTPGKDYQNSVSIDQIAAELHGKETRFPSLELSGDGTSTLSFDRFGTPLPSEQQPPRLFRRLFVPEDRASREATLKRYEERSSILDVVMGQASSLKKRLGKADQRKVDEYLSSVRETERRVDRAKNWVDAPRPNVEKTDLQLSSNWYSYHDRSAWLDVMLELAYLAFQTDITRIITFQWSREAGQITHNGEHHHELSHHGGNAEKLKKLAEIDRFHVGRLARFLELLQSTKEADDSSMLDRTMILYGSGMNSGKGGGHSGKNLPLLLAGGTKLGLKQGQHLSFEVDSTPMSNLLLTLLQKMGIKKDSFGDSTGTLAGLT